MNPSIRISLCIILTIALLSAPLRADSTKPETARTVFAANVFLATLDQKQRESVMFKFDDQQQRVRWSNLPTTMVRRAGLRMGELNDAQRSAAMTLLASA